jgi:hypothetical protein
MDAAAVLLARCGAIDPRSAPVKQSDSKKGPLAKLQLTFDTLDLASTKPSKGPLVFRA